MTQAPKLRHVDPHRPRGQLYLAVCRFSTTGVGRWLAEKVAWKLDPLLLRLTRGRFSTTGPVAAGLLRPEAHVPVGRGEPQPSTSMTATG